MQLYIESDGQVYLVRRNEMLDLPRADEVPFDIEQIARLATNAEVWFCVPLLEEHPSVWFEKDEIPVRANVAPLVRVAVHASMPRVVVEGICPRNGEVLLVKGNRGLTEGRWTLPGGFLRFGETPEEGILREIREEVGLAARIENLVAVRSMLGEHTRLHWVMLFYHTTIEGVPRPNPDEIAEARFVSIEQAVKMLPDETMGGVVRAFA